MTTRTEILMNVLDDDGAFLVQNRLVRPEHVGTIVMDAIKNGETNVSIRLDVARFHGEPFRRVAA